MTSKVLFLQELPRDESSRDVRYFIKYVKMIAQS